MKDTRFFALFLLLALISPILFYHCNYFDFSTSVHKVRSFAQLFAGQDSGSSSPSPANDEDAGGDPNRAAYRPEAVVKSCNLQKDKDLIVDSKQLRASQSQSQSPSPSPKQNTNMNPQRRLNCANKKNEQGDGGDGSDGSDGSDVTSTEYHLDKTRNRPIVSEKEDGRVASTYDKLIADIPSSFPAILDEGGENPRQTAEVVSKKRKKRRRGRDNKRRHHQKRNRNQRRSPRRRNMQQEEEPRRETEVQLVLDDVRDELDLEMDMDADMDMDVEEAGQDEGDGPLGEDGFDDMEVGEVLLQLGRAIKKTAVVMSNHAVQYPKDVCVVIVFVLLLIKLATWLSGGYRQARRNLVPLATSVPLLSTSASRATSFSEGGLKPTLQTSFTCIPQTMESIRHLLPAESQPVIPRGLLKTGFGYQTASDTCNLRGIPDTFTILKNMPADIDVADIYLDTFRRMALQAGKMKTANLLKESQLFLEYRRNSYLKNNLPQNQQNDSSSRVIPTDSVLANISTDSQN